MNKNYAKPKADGDIESCMYWLDVCKLGIAGARDTEKWNIWGDKTCQEIKRNRLNTKKREIMKNLIQESPKITFAETFYRTHKKGEEIVYKVISRTDDSITVIEASSRRYKESTCKTFIENGCEYFIIDDVRTFAKNKIITKVPV